jgi:hypothetical protein
LQSLQEENKIIKNEIERKSNEYEISLKKCNEETKIFYEKKLDDDLKLLNLKMNEYETENIQLKKENESIMREKEIIEENLKNLEVKLEDYNFELDRRSKIYQQEISKLKEEKSKEIEKMMLENERISSNKNIDLIEKDMEKHKFIGELSSSNCNLLII